MNAIQLENSKPGTTEWNRGTIGVRRIEGFASATTAVAGEEVRFYARNTSPEYRIEIYRLGWYGGDGARLVYASGNLPKASQPDCEYDEAFRSTSCHNWQSVHAVTIPDDWTTGLYWVKFAEADGPGLWYTATAFVVRESTPSAQILIQAPFNRHQMYNAYGGRAWHYGPAGFEDRSLRVSFDRPWDRGWYIGLTFEYPFIRWAEKEGYSLAYSAAEDTHLRPELMRSYRAWILPGHDEHWTREVRDNIEAARDAGVHLGFFGGCDGYRQVRYEDSPLGPNRRLVHYYFPVLDPFFTGEGGVEKDLSRVAVSFRQSPVNRPENELIGVMYLDGNSTNPQLNYEWVATGPFDHWLFENTGMTDGDKIAGVVAHEYDSVAKNGKTPETLQVFSASPACNGISGNCGVSNTSLYQAPSGALVFAAGTVQWPNALDRFMSPCGANCPEADPRLQQISRNVIQKFLAVTDTVSKEAKR